MIDYSNRLSDLPPEKWVIMECYLVLTKMDMIESLKYDYVTIQGVEYLTPERQILNYLIEKKTGKLYLKFIRKEKHN